MCGDPTKLGNAVPRKSEEFQRRAVVGYLPINSAGGNKPQTGTCVPVFTPSSLPADTTPPEDRACHTPSTLESKETLGAEGKIGQ